MTLGYSELTGKIYAVTASNKRQDVTDDFFAVLLKKFPAGTEHIITLNGEPKFEIKITEKL